MLQDTSPGRTGVGEEQEVPAQHSPSLEQYSPLSRHWEVVLVATITIMAAIRRRILTYLFVFIIICKEYVAFVTSLLLHCFPSYNFQSQWEEVCNSLMTFTCVHAPELARIG